MTDRTKGVVAMVVLALVFAVVGIFARELDAGFSLLQQLYLRIGLAFLLAALMFAPFIDWRAYARIQWWEWGLLAFRGISMYFAVLLWTYAILHTSYSNVAFVSAIPLLPFFGYYFFGDKLNIRIVSFIGLGILGFLLIGVKDWSDILSVGKGELAALASVLFFDLVYIGRKWQSGLLSNGATATVMFLFGSVFLLGASFGIGEELPSLSVFTPWLVLMLVVAALLNVFHVTLTNYGFSKLTVTLAGTILMLESIFALGISIWLYNEVPTLIEFAGSALILFSVYKINQLT